VPRRLHLKNRVDAYKPRIAASLPDTGYMVLMDKIYLLAYLIISLVLLQVIRSGNWLVAGRQRLSEARLIRLERRLAVLYLLAFFVGVLVLSA
jgi:predicted hotdog family 3-hydroxylacyl-ACP dehydratase